MRLVGAEKLAALFADSRQPCGVRFLGRVKTAEMDRLMVPFYLSSETLSFARSPHAAGKSSFRSAAVPFVLLMRCLAQIFPAIIPAVTILVVDRTRPFAGLHGPDYAVHPMVSVIHVDKVVSPIGVGASRSPAGEKSIPGILRVLILKVMKGARFPGQQARRGVVIQTLTQVLCAGQLLGHGSV